MVIYLVPMPFAVARGTFGMCLLRKIFVSVETTMTRLALFETRMPLKATLQQTLLQLRVQRPRFMTPSLRKPVFMLLLPVLHARP